MEIPSAPLKELRSTGYFHDQLKTYSGPMDMDLATYCSSFVSPYLIKMTEDHERTGQFHKSRLLKLAIQHLSASSDNELVDSIFGLRKVAASEVDKATKMDFAGQLDKADASANRQKLQAAEFLLKLLVNIIKIFKLAEPNAGRSRADEEIRSISTVITESWEAMDKKIP